MEIRKLGTFHPEARRIFFEKQSDGFSYADFLDESILALASVRKNGFITPDDLKTYVGNDVSSPTGEKTFCALKLIDLMIEEIKARYPVVRRLKTVIGLYNEVDEMLDNMPRSKIPPREIVQAQKRLENTLNSWPIEDLQYVHDIFIKIKNEILARERFGGAEMIARYRAKIQARGEDKDPGSILKKNGKEQYIGSYVAVGVNKRACFQKIVFMLGLEPGYHLLAACGNASYDKKHYRQSHLYHLKNFRLKLPDKDREPRHWWDPLPSKIYSEALENKNLFEKTQNTEKGKKIAELWQEARSNKEEEVKAIWIDGEALRAKLDIIPDEKYSHTVRAIALRKNQITGNWEILLQTEKGDNKKFPGIGCPGGTVDYKESVGRALERETENESMCGKVTKIIAQVAENKKARKREYTRDNFDHWFLIETIKEHCLPGRLREPQEIKADSQRWIPLSELPTFTFQDSNRPVRNLQTVEERKMMYFGHAINISRALPCIMEHIPELELAPNWNQFIENIRKFKESL